MQPIEGITPQSLWTFLGVLVGLGALIVLADKVMDVWRKHKARKKIESGPESQLAEEISKKVLEKLEPRFQEIDRKLNNDKVRLDDQAQKLTRLGARNDTLEAGQKAMCRGVLALLSHEINGNSTDKLRDAQTDINNFLIEK
ncbi:MAG: hypothetical protein IJP78_07960 [Clostridia bacterium]|nr:hypothetical protein [Clostridia bacterium]MBQ6960893.1 hypothetical protein [Clostridia bacterium]